MDFDGETFGADCSLRRAEPAVILNGLLGRTPSSLDDLPLGMPIFDDNRGAQAWYFLPIQEAAVAHTAAETGAHERWAEGCAEHRLHKDTVRRGRVIL